MRNTETIDCAKAPVRGYKIIGKDWMCRDKQYSCPGDFKEDVDLSLCEKGMHFCEKLSDCFEWVSSGDVLSQNHYVEVEAYGECVKGKSKCCTDKLRIIRELFLDEIIFILKEESGGSLNWGFW